MGERCIRSAKKAKCISARMLRALKICKVLSNNLVSVCNKRKNLSYKLPNWLKATPQSLMGYIARKANEVKRCPKVKQNMRINMALTILDNIVRFKRNLKKLFGSKAEIWLSPQNLHCKISIFSNEKKSRA